VRRRRNEEETRGAQQPKLIYKGRRAVRRVGQVGGRRMAEEVGSGVGGGVAMSPDCFQMIIFVDSLTLFECGLWRCVGGGLRRYVLCKLCIY
jgi:hypothetical protein